eukprot:986299-Lingulodinium_polyedra.AAC.1
MRGGGSLATCSGPFLERVVLAGRGRRELGVACRAMPRRCHQVVLHVTNPAKQDVEDDLSCCLSACR